MSTFHISKSSLLSLKAEILRKQDELKKAELGNLEKIRIFKKKTLFELKNKNVEDREKNDVAFEEVDVLKLSRTQLEAKANLYEKLSGQAANLETSKYLVKFDKKEKLSETAVSDLNDSGSSYGVRDDQADDFDDEKQGSDSSDEWTEYEDCLGRSRKCLKKHLEHFKSKDSDLKEMIEKQEYYGEYKKTTSGSQVSENNLNATMQDENVANTPELTLVASDTTNEILRHKWEIEEDELKFRDNIHYQNVLFDEARQHGVGYYAFSKNEKERLMQQDELRNLRKITDLYQKKTQELRDYRENQLALRIKAAKNRRRARYGLPPEEEEEEDKMTGLTETKSELSKDTCIPVNTESDQRAAELRRKHIRPWDIGKEGVGRYVISQEEWNEIKRSERITEFAPPQSLNCSVPINCMNNAVDNKDDRINIMKRKNYDYRIEDSHKVRKPTPKAAPFLVSETSTINKNETRESHLLRSGYNISNNSEGKQLNMMDAVEAGLKFLRQQSES